MRTMIIETIEPGESELKTELTNSHDHLLLLIDLGLNVKELLANSTAEFLSPGGAQYRVSVLSPGAFMVHEFARNGRIVKGEA